MDKDTAMKFTQQSIDIHKSDASLWGRGLWVGRRGGKIRWCILGGAAAESFAAEGREFTCADVEVRGKEIARALNLPFDYAEGPLGFARSAGPAIAWLVEHVPGLHA